jgi:glutaminase
VGERTSKRVRHVGERRALIEASDRSAVFELQGELNFMAVESVSRMVTDGDITPDLVLLDLRRVSRVDPSGSDFSLALASFLADQGGRLVLASADLLEQVPSSALVFADLDAALEWCEDELLLRSQGHPNEQPTELDAHELLRDLEPDEFARLVPQLGFTSAKAGTILVRAGEPAAEIFLVTQGSLSVYVQPAGRPPLRLSTLSAGMTFGEIAYVDRAVRSADVRADSDVECRTLSFEALDSLLTTDPHLQAKLLRSLIRVVVSRLRSSDAEVAELSR